MKVLGLTGGICSGKSTLAKLLEERYGIKSIDADKLGHLAYLPGTECFGKLVEAFGDIIVDTDGSINRRVLGSIVFSNKLEMKKLESIVWPEIRRRIVDRIEEFRQEGEKIVFLEAAVMIEASWDDLVSTLWCTSVDRETAIQRLMQRNGLSESDSTKRVDSQISNEERCMRANKVFDNSLDLTTFVNSICEETDILIGQLDS